MAKHFKATAIILGKVTNDMVQTIGNRVNTKIQKNIQRGIDVNNKKFEPLSEETTIPERSRKNFGNKPLILELYTMKVIPHLQNLHIQIKGFQKESGLEFQKISLEMVARSKNLKKF